MAPSVQKKCFLFFVFVLLLFFVASVAHADYIVDNGDPDFSTVGAWTNSTLVAGYYGRDYSWVTGGATVTATANFVFNLPLNGYYQVFSWWSTPFEARSPDAPHTIYHARGSTTIDMDQRVNGGRWNKVGVFYFSSGQARVSISNQAQGNPVADAVRVLFVGGDDYLSAGFSAEPVTGQAPMAATFTDNSVGDVAGWRWDFGDGAVSSEKNPTHIYQATGTYTVELTVSNAAGQSDTAIKNGFIEVEEAPSDYPGSSHPYENGMDKSWVYTLEGNAATIAVTFDPLTAVEAQYDFIHVMDAAGSPVSGSPFTGASLAGQTVTLSGNTVIVRLVSDGAVNRWGFAITDVREGGELPLPESGHPYPDNANALWRYTLDGNPLAIQVHFDPQTQVEAGHDFIHVLDGQSNPVSGSPFSGNSLSGQVLTLAGDTVQIRLVSDGGVTGWGFRITQVGVAPLIAGFDSQPLIGVAPLPVVFSDTSQGGAQTWYWDFGDGSTSTEQHPAHTYVSPGAYTVSLVVTGNSQQNEIIRTHYVTALGSGDVNAVFSASPSSGQGPLSVSFTDSSIGDIDTWFWDFGDGSTSSAQNPTHIYATPGVYAVSLTVSGNGISNTQTRSDYISVFDGPPPAAAFSAAPVFGPSPLRVTFSDQSAGAITTWLWDFGDGNTSDERTPTHTYQNPGVYTVRLTVAADGQSDVELRTNYITVAAPDDVATAFTWPVEESAFFIFQAFGNQRSESSNDVYHAGTDFGVYAFDVPVRAIANGWVEHFDGYGNAIMLRHLLPDGEIVYSWYHHLASPVNGQFTPGQFIAMGAQIGVVGESGWTPSGMHLHLEIKKNKVVYGGYIENLSDHHNPYEFLLTRLAQGMGGGLVCSDGTPVGEPSATPPYHCIEGAVLVENAIEYGCDSGVPQADGTCSKTEPGIIVDNDDPGFSLAGYWERSTEVMGFYGKDFYKAYSWDNSPSTASWTPTITEPGYYRIYGWWRDRFSAEPSTRASNAVLTVVHGDQQSMAPVDFSDYFKQWKYIGNFYLPVGTGSSIRLSDQTQTGDIVADAFRFVFDSAPIAPTASFSANQTTGAAPLIVVFSDSSNGDITSWLWDFGDGATSGDRHPTHQYAAEGVYSVSLTVSGPGGGNLHTKTDYITVTPPPAAPAADFVASPLSGRTPLTVVFTDTSSGAIDSWLWDFGDGATSSDRHPTHQYVSEGSYGVSLTVTGPGGSNTQTKQDYVVVGAPEPAPSADFTATPLSGSLPLEVVFTDTSSGALNAWSWDFGDGGVSSERDPVHQYIAQGQYTIRLTVSGPGGSDTMTRVNYITVSANEIYDAIVDNSDTAFSTVGSWSTSSSIPGYYGGNYRWTYGGSGAAKAQWRFDLPADGYYQVMAWWSAPFATRAADAPYTVYHQNTSTTIHMDQTTGGGRWNDVGVFYFTAGAARVELNNNTRNNPVADAIRFVFKGHQGAVAADFSASPLTGGAPLDVYFTDHSSGLIDSWTWDFGDGGVSSARDPVHQYATEGIYTIRLTVSGPGGNDTMVRADYVAVSAGALYDAIIDNGATGFTTVGSWSTSTSVSGYYGSNYSWTYGGSGAAKAQWRFDLPVDGYYQVLAWWSAPYATRPTDAPYTVYHQNASTTVPMDQTSGGGRWNDVGAFYFTAGAALVELSNNTQNNPVADAVRIVHIE